MDCAPRLSAPRRHLIPTRTPGRPAAAPGAPDPSMNSLNHLRLQLRFARLLLWEFRRPLAVFLFLILAGGWVLHAFSHRREVSYVESCYAVFQLLFFQSQLDFPQESYLQPLFFLLPLLGLWALADSVVRLGYLI